MRVFLERYRLGDSDHEGEHRLLVDRYLGTLAVGIARDVEQLLATQPSELDPVTADPSPSETQLLLQRALDFQAERERAHSAEQPQIDVRACQQREHELLKQLRALLDDAQRALCEAFPTPGMTRTGVGLAPGLRDA